MRCGPNPSGLCMCGCGERTPIATRDDLRYDAVKGKPRKYILGHSNRKSPFEYVVQAAGFDTPCWLWQKAIGKAGYGNLYLNGETKNAHRVFFERARGPVPDGLMLDHLCRNRHCVNPDHMEPVTNRENTLRGLRGRLRGAA